LKTIQFHIFYASGILLGALVLLQALRLKERATSRRAFLLGLLIGVGLWQSFQLVTIIPPVLGWLIFRRRELLRFAPVTTVGACVGLLPVLISNLKHDWWSFELGSNADGKGYLGRLWQLFTNTLPIALDLRAPVTLDWFAWKPIGLGVYSAALVGFVWLWRQSRPGRRFERAEVLVVVATAFPFIYALSPMTTLGDLARYVLVLTPVIALLLTAWIRTTRQAVVTSVAILTLLAGAGLQLWKADSGSRSSGAVTLPRSFAPLYAELDRLHLRRLYATYWIANRITYETGERIVASEMRPSALRSAPNGALVPLPHDPTVFRRHPEYQAIVSRDPWPSFVVVKGFDPSSTEFDEFTHSGYRSAFVGPFSIYYRRG
jgi:hypothetical protein